LSVVAAAAVPICATRIENQAARAARVARVERTRPVVAERLCVGQTTIVAIAGSWQENTTTIRLTGHLITIHTFLRSPSPIALFSQLGQFIYSGHAPTAAPIDTGSIVGQV